MTEKMKNEVKDPKLDGNFPPNVYFNAVGENIIGILGVRREVSQKSYVNVFYEFLLKDASKGITFKKGQDEVEVGPETAVSFKAHTRLDRKLRQLKEGTEVTITFDGQVQTPQGGTANNYTVLTD